MTRMHSKLTMLVAVSLLGCGAEKSEQQPMTWEQFKSAAYFEADTGVWVVNGDELAATEADLRAAYDRYAAERTPTGATAQTAQPLIVNVVNGHDDVWSATQAQAITYCVSKSSFGTTRYNLVVSAMEQATGAWEGSANIQFVHLADQDSNCTRNNNNVVFNLRRVTTSQYLARAFFPSSSRSNRELLIATATFGDISPYTLAGVLRHELGHTIGLRHEHTRPEAGTCFEDNSWRALTVYDSDSVMHYPQCNGTNEGDLVLTELDQEGVALLYP